MVTLLCGVKADHVNHLSVLKQLISVRLVEISYSASVAQAGKRMLA